MKRKTGMKRQTAAGTSCQESLRGFHQVRCMYIHITATLFGVLGRWGAGKAPCWCRKGSEVKLGEIYLIMWPLCVENIIQEKTSAI